MTDLDKAKKLLKEEELTIAVVKDGKVIFKSKDKGIKPMYLLATEMRGESRGASLADRVIGKGAALLCGYIGIQELYTELISEGGISALESYHIPYESNQSCEYIQNMNRSDYCPIEKLSLTTDDPIVLLQKIKEFFERRL